MHVVRILFHAQDWMAGFPHGAGHSVPRARKRRRSFIVGVHVGLQGQGQSVNGLCMLQRLLVSPLFNFRN